MYPCEARELQEWRNQIVKKLLVINNIAALALALLVFVPGAEAQNNKHDKHAAPSRHKAAPPRFQPRGHQAKVLPAGHLRLSVGGSPFFYYGGVFYRSQGAAYIVVAAPIGARVRRLPAGFVSLSIGARRYYHLNSTYYYYEPQTQEYVVVAEPEGAAGELSAAEPSGQLFVYPNNGQSEEQSRRDRYECYVWASEKSGFDPARPDQPSEFQFDYDRGLSACLAGRGYTVR